MTTIVVASIQALATIIVAVFSYFTNHKVQKLSEVKEELKTSMNEQHKETLSKIADLEQLVDTNDIDTVRSRIVAFENLCRLDKSNNTLKKHQYDTIFKDITKWAVYHEKYKYLNGEIDIAVENIKEHYKGAIDL